MYEHFLKIKKVLNSIKFYGLEQIMLGDAFTIEISEVYLNSNIKSKFSRLILKLISISLSITYENHLTKIGDKTDSNILFYFSHIYEKRDDYVNSIKKVETLFNSRVELTGKRIKRRPKIKNIRLLFLTPIWIYQLRVLKCKFSTKLRILQDIYTAKIWSDYIVYNIIPKKYSSLVVYFDARSFDNILVQYFKLHNIPTATLQHGHFNATSNSKDIGIAFEGFVSDKFLAWGEYTKGEAIKNGIDPSRIECVGCQKYINYNRESTYHNNQKVFGVILDGGGGKTIETNINMINISNRLAESKNYKYVIKPHPVSDISIFEKFIDKKHLSRIASTGESVEDYAKTVDFSIAMGSSVYSELIYLKKIVFRFVNDVNIDRYNEISWGKFKDYIELLRLVNLYEIEPDHIYTQSKKVKDFLFASGDVALNYYNAISRLISEEKRV